MKTLLTLLICALFSLSAYATEAADTENRPDRALVLEYLELSRFEQALNINLDAQYQQFKNAPGANPAQIARIEKMLRLTMDWDATKDQLVEMVRTLYTKEELDASIAFMKTPLGASATAKDMILAAQFGDLISQKLLKFLREHAQQKPAGKHNLSL